MMFSKEEVKSNLLGCFETMLFMKGGTDRFMVSKSATLRSFYIPLLMFPFLVAIYLTKSTGVELPILIILLAIKVAAPLALYMLIVNQFCKKLDLEEHFYRFAIAYNWFEIPMLVLYLPIIFAAFYGGIDHPQIQSYTIFCLLVGYMFTGYIAYKTLNISWELGVLLGVVAMAVFDNTHKLFDYLNIL